MYCLIYLLANTITGKKYVGQTWCPLKLRMSRGYNGNPHLRASIAKYGKENFRYQVLTVCSTQRIADFYEDYFITRYDTINNGYNIKSGGSHGRQSDETKAKISAANFGKRRTPEQKLTISRSVAGEKHPHYGKKGALSQNYGKRHTNTTKEKRSKITKVIADRIRLEYAHGGISQQKLADRYGISQDVVSRIVLNKIWNSDGDQKE